MAKKEKETIFRKETLDRISSPDPLTDYLRVASPGIWVVLASGLASFPGAATPSFLALSLQFRRVCSEMPSSLDILVMDSLFGGSILRSMASLSSGL